jgi:hypothetical protein
MTNNNDSKEDFQGKIENLLRNNASRSNSKEEIINLMSSEISTQREVEQILGEMEVWSSMKDTSSSVYSSCKGGTVYFQWGQSP